VVADLDVERANVAVLEDLALADGDDLAAGESSTCQPLLQTPFGLLRRLGGYGEALC
jgi:hypothetical protein